MSTYPVMLGRPFAEIADGRDLSSWAYGRRSCILIDCSLPNFGSPLAGAAALDNSQVRTSPPHVSRQKVVRPVKRRLPFSSGSALQMRLSPRLTDLTLITVQVGHRKFLF